MLFPLFVACQGNTSMYVGSPVWETFPFDGQRTWEFTSTDTALPYKLVASSDTEPEEKQGTRLYLVDYWTRCLGADPSCINEQSLRTLQWSSTVTDGVFIHGYSVNGGTFVELNPPVQVAFDTMKKDQVAETVTGGATWSSELLGEETCPALLGEDWTCSLFEVTTDTGDGYPIAGRYWNVKGTGFAAMEIATETGMWQLSSFGCEGECEGDW